MSTNITYSVLGLYKADPRIFDNISIPTDVDKDVLVSNILMESAELEVLYASADFMKYAIENWSKKELPKWNRLNDLLKIQLDPTRDYDYTRTEIRTLEREKTNDDETVKTYNSTDSKTGTESTVGDNTISTDQDYETKDTGTQTNAGTDTTTVSAYNSSGWENRDKVTHENTLTNNLTSTETGTNERSEDLHEQTTYNTQNRKTGTDSVGFDGNESVTEEYNSTITEKGHKAGLIDFIERSVDLAYNNIYDIITTDFIHRFCLLIY